MIDLDAVEAIAMGWDGAGTTILFTRSNSFHVAMDYWTAWKLWAEPGYAPGREH